MATEQLAAGECGNLAALRDLSEETLLEELRVRFMNDNIYTYVGEILVAVNPYKKIDGMYDIEAKKKYRNGVDKDTVPPHIFAIADNAFEALKKDLKNQVCVISGESGAGKTESAKHFLRHIIDLSTASESPGLSEKIIKVNPMLEAFGNAQTLMNDNSSRFGKYLDLRFNRDLVVRGASMTEYLLEKSRVVHQGDGERNFHIFYYIFAGLGADQYDLGEANDHRYLSANPDAVADISTPECKQMWDEVSACFDTVGFTPEEKDNVFALLSAILNLGDVTFEGDEAATVSGFRGSMEKACVQLGVSDETFELALTTQVLIIRGEETTKDYKCDQADDCRDAAAKALYGRGFAWIIERVNALLGPKTQSAQDIKISFLDIFGFENFDYNSFEQLCINLANEQLQFYFNTHIFQDEIDEYATEGIDGSKASYIPNKPTLNLILGKPLGLLNIMDEQAIMPKSSDVTMLESFHKTHSEHNSYVRPQGNREHFTIKHYAGDVRYDTPGFLEKNRDTLAIDVMGALRVSENALVRHLFSGDEEDAKSAKGMRAKKRAGERDTNMSRKKLRQSMKKVQTQMAKKKIQTVGASFKESLVLLMANLNAAAPHFIRCIKPNTNKTSHEYDVELVTKQLRYTGMLETTRIRREGYSVRPTFEEFVFRYSALAFTWDLNTDDAAACCAGILEAAKQDDYQLGKTKVFLRWHHSDTLNEISRPIAEAGTALIRCARGLIARINLRKLLDGKAQLVEKVATFFGAIERQSIADVVQELCEQDSKRPLSYWEPEAEPELEDPTPSNNKKKGGAGGDMKRAASVRWFKEVEMKKGNAMADADEANAAGLGGFAQWFHGVISRKESEALLQGKKAGTFLIRVSETRFGYSLSVLSTDGRIKHFMIDQTENAQYMVVGNDRRFKSLNALASHHRKSKLTEKDDKLLFPCPQKESNLTELIG